MAITANDIKKLSPQAKALIVIVVILVIGYLYYFYFLSDLIAKKTTLEKENQDIQVQIKQKEKVALELNKYKGEVDKLTDSYKVALLKLPDQREIPGLFHSVSLAGKDAGIEFSLFEPKPAVPKGMPESAKPKVSAMLKPSDQRPEGAQKADAQKPVKDKPGDKKKEPEPFYEEIPVKVTVTGSFQNTVHFFEKVAKLPRIVNVSDISMGDRKNVKGRGDLITTSCTVKTYMFVDKKRADK